MQLWKISLTLLLLSSCATSSSEATSARALNPLENITDLKVKVFVGGSVGAVHKKKLFFRDEQREAHFKKTLKHEAESALRSAGFQISEESADSVGIAIWGNREGLPSGEIINVFLVEVLATDVDYKPESPCYEEQDFKDESNAIGIAFDQELEEVLRSEALRLLQEMLPVGQASPN